MASTNKQNTQHQTIFICPCSSTQSEKEKSISTECSLRDTKLFWKKKHGVKSIYQPLPDMNKSQTKISLRTAKLMKENKN
jgi:hypothetical protein